MLPITYWSAIQGNFSDFEDLGGMTDGPISKNADIKDIAFKNNPFDGKP